MAWADVLLKITFPTVTEPNATASTMSPGDRAIFLDLLEQIYAKPTAQAALDAITASRTLKVVHSDLTDTPGFRGAGDVIGVNLLLIESTGYFNTHGTWVRETGAQRALTAIHEILHSLPAGDTIGNDDATMNGSSFDYLGDVGKKQNDIATEMGWTDYIQAAYDAAMIAGSPTETRPTLGFGTNYTDGNDIDYARLGDQPGKSVVNLIDHSSRATRDLVLAFTGDDVIKVGAAKDFVYGGEGNDEIFGGSGNDFLHGGDLGVAGNDGVDTANYTTGDNGAATPGGITVLVSASAPQYDGRNVITVQDDGTGATDRLVSIERIIGTDQIDTVMVTGPVPTGMRLEVDARGTPTGGRDILDLRQMGGVAFTTGRIGTTDVVFTNFDLIQFGDEVDTYYSTAVGVSIDLGGESDWVFRAGSGTEITTGAGADWVILQDNVRVLDASSEDHIFDFSGAALTGAIRWAGSAVAFAFNPAGSIGYALNEVGDLVIRNFADEDRPEMFIANFARNFALGGGMGPGGIYVAEAEIGAYKILEDKPSHMSWLGTWELFMGHFMKANFGVSMWNGVDPLVLDLDGDGLELTGQSAYAPYFDYDGDGYGERGGWVSGDDGMLVLDANADGEVSDIGELFGGPGLSGFAELATHDLNADGVIDASDAVYSQLKVWRDLNQNRVVDAGEMVSLASLGITAIGVAGVASTATVNGNDIVATGGFTRGDGSNGLVGDVGFQVDQQRTEWLGDVTVSAAAAALPELRGFGTLSNLRIAMTLDPAMQSVAGTVLPLLDTLDLASMRAAVLPLLTAWADASPITGTVPLGGHEDIPVLTETVEGQRVVTDYAYQAVNSETGLTEWRLASTGAVIADLQALLSATPAGPDAPDWSEFDGAWIDFFERYLGEALPIGGEPADGAGAAAGLQGVIAGMWQTLDLLTVRLAMQGPLSDYFADLEYDVVSDTFRPTSERQLIPVFEAVFAEVAAMTSGGIGRLEAWREVLDIVIGDYRQPDGVLNTNGFLFSNIVAAYESTGLSLGIVDVGAALGLPAELIRTGAGTLTGGDDADLFYLGAGDQIAVGGLGPDTYVVGRGFGHDVIDELEPVLTTHSEDVIRFADIASTEVTATRDGLDLILTVNGTTDELRVVDHFDGRLPGLNGGGDLSSSTGVDFILFADGVQWTPFDVARAVSRSTAGDDAVLGTETVDWLDGGAGDDFLSGGNDSDVYVYGHSYGHDVISDLNGHIDLTGPDYLSFTDGITLGDLVFSRAGSSDDLLITVDGQDGSVTLVNQFAATYTGMLGTYWIDQIEGFLFDDGSSAGWRDVAALLLDQASTSGADTIYGFSLEDRLDGGAGDDFMSGGNENDTYVFGAGYGHDIIHEQWSNILSGGVDVVEFTQETLPGDVAFTRDGDDLIVTIVGSGDTLRIRDQYVVTETGTLGTLAFNQIEHFRFSDGTVLAWPDIRTAIIDGSQTPGDDLILGTHFDDAFQGGTGDDRIQGGNGGDTYRFNVGDGADTIRDHLDNLFTDRADTIVFGEGISADDIVITRYGAEDNSVRLAIGATGDSVSIEQQFAYTTIALKEYEVERFAFHDGTIWTAADLRLHYLAQAQTAGDDLVIGFWTNDQIEGGAGDDVLKGGDGSDTYRFDLGFGVDEIREFVDNVSFEDDDGVIFGTGLLFTDAVFTRTDDDLTISFAGMADHVTIVGQFEPQAFDDGARDIETFTFGDNVVLTPADIREWLLAQASTTGADLITGFSSVADTIDGGAGNDTLRGLGGGDTYVFGAGSGQDLIQESIGSLYENQPDTLQFAAGVAREDVTFTRDGADLLVTLAGTTDSVRVQDHFGESGYASVERFLFEGGLEVSKAEVALIVLANQSTPEDDVIVGSAGADVITGGAGNDTLRGGDGPDTYYFGQGFGVDVIDETVGDVSISDFDVIEFGSGLLAQEAVISRDGDDLIIAFPAGDSVRVLRQFQHQAWFAGWEDVEAVRFQDGTGWTQGYIRERLLDEQSTEGDDTITGYWDADVFDGRGGNDVIHGGGGNDTYVFGFGSGHDVIHETFAVYEGAFDTIALKDGVEPGDVSFMRIGDNLVATLSGGQDSLTVANFFLADTREVEAFTFTNGASLDLVQLTALAVAGQTTSGDDAIMGSRLADALAGGLGADTLSGGAGSDSYAFDLGEGRDVIEDKGASASDSIVLGVGVTPSNVTLYRSGVHLVIEIGGEDLDAILVRNQFSGSPDVIESIVFSSGVVWGSSEIAANLEILPAGHVVGTFVAEMLTGTSGADTLTGRDGDDALLGGAGSDDYIYGSGDGSDTISETSTSATDLDILRMTDFAPGEVQLQRVGADLRIVLDGAVVTVAGHFSQVGAGVGIEGVELGGGVVWDRATIDALAWVLGTDGADTISLGAGDTTIAGGLGADLLGGGAGADTFVYASGDGADRVVEDSSVGADTLSLTDLNASDIMLTRNGSHMMVRDLATGQAIQIDYHFWSGVTGNGYGIETIRFADQTVWTRADMAANTWISGTTGADSLGGYADAENFFGDLGDDHLGGGAGADVFLYRSGDGADRISEDSNVGADVLKFADLNAEDVELSRNGSDLYIKDLSTGQAIKVDYHFFTGTASNGYGIETLRFANGAEWDREDIAANAWFRGTSGADGIAGSGSIDTLFGGAGDDGLYGGAEADTYIYRSGDGADLISDDSGVGADVLHLVDLDASDVLVARSGSNLLITDLSTSQSITVQYHFFSGPTGNGYGIETIRFADGTTWNRQQIADETSGLAAVAMLSGKDALQVLPTLADDETGAGLTGLVICWPGAPEDDFVVKSDKFAPLVLPSDLYTPAVRWEFLTRFGVGQPLTLLEDGTISDGPGVHLPAREVDHDWWGQ